MLSALLLSFYVTAKVTPKPQPVIIYWKMVEPRDATRAQTKSFRIAMVRWQKCFQPPLETEFDVEGSDTEIRVNASSEFFKNCIVASTRAQLSDLPKSWKLEFSTRKTPGSQAWTIPLSGIHQIEQ